MRVQLARVHFGQAAKLLFESSDLGLQALDALQPTGGVVADRAQGRAQLVQSRFLADVSGGCSARGGSKRARDRGTVAA